jgi:hypothetical protein
MRRSLASTLASVASVASVARVASLACLALSACAHSVESSDANAQPIAGECAHDFVLPHDDGVLTDVGVVNAYWGAYWQRLPGSAARVAQNATWSQVANDARFYRAMQAYAPKGKAITGRSMASGSLGGSLGGMTSIGKDVFEGELRRALGAGELPARSGDTTPIYVVYLPPGTNGPPLDAPDGPVAYAAYHHFMPLADGTNVPYVVVMFDDADSLDIAESHEIYETIANPYQRGWHDRYKDPHGLYAEIADVCAGDVTSFDGHAVQRLWSPSACACVDPSVVGGP